MNQYLNFLNNCLSGVSENDINGEVNKSRNEERICKLQRVIKVNTYI